MFDLTGKKALVTGASGGIGGAVAAVLHAAGATVALSGTREAPLRELAESLGARAHVVTANLGDAAEVEALPKAAAEAMGGIDILVNNAGITRDNLFMRMSDEEWAHYVFFRDNTKGVWAERWSHSAGCRRWFNALRNTVTYRFDAIYRLDEPRPEIS